MRIIFILLLIIATSLTLSGCYTKFYKKTNANIEQSQLQIAHAKMLSEQITPPVITKPGFYVDTQPHELDNQPLWVKKIVTLRANHLPFNLLVNRLLRNSPVIASYDNTVQSQRLVSMNYTGTVQGALETLSSETDYHFTASDHNIRWSAFESRTFDISFMPCSSNYLVGQQQNSTSNNNFASSGSPLGQINDQQYSNLEGQLSLWED